MGTYRGLRTISHDGGDAGYRATVLWFPDQQLGIAIVSNLGEFNPGALAREVAALVPYDRLIAGFVNDSGDYLEVVGQPEGASWGLGEVVPVVGSGPGSALLNGKPILQLDLLRSHRFIEDMRLLEEGIRSYVLVPIGARGRTIGVLGFASRSVATYDVTSLPVIQPIADAVALALENVRLFQKTRELSITDEVTPLFNFRHFHQILARELKLVDRYKSVLALIFIDLDRFKPINDQWGRPTTRRATAGTSSA